MPATSNHRSIAKYAKKAGLYDGTAHRTDWIRQHTIDLLELRPGEVVLDVGCGSGLSFAQLRAKVGPAGSVVGIDQSPEMLALAQRRIAENGWTNTRAVEAFTEHVELPWQFDALLFHYTHDILQSETSVRNVLAYAKPNARIAIAGMKYFPIWLEPLNLYAFFKNYAWNGNGAGLRRPWRHIERLAELAPIRSTQVGMGYITHGVVSAPQHNHKSHIEA
jgi:SAM-dependent methyltransferase